MLVLSVFVFTFLWDIDGWWLVWAWATQQGSLGHRVRHEASQAQGPARDAFIQIFPPPFLILIHSSHWFGPFINAIPSINRYELNLKLQFVLSCFICPVYV